ncbi:MAG: CDP-glucose 4,6-dehydratase [Gemmatimonadales bacterium]
MIADLNNWYHGRNVFVTGNTGFKGAWLTAWLRNAGANVAGYALPPTQDRLNLFRSSGLALEIDSTLADICDGAALEQALRAFKPEVVFHLAAQSLVMQSYVDPLETYRTNVMGTAHVLDAVRRVPSVKAVVVVTSDKCYENRDDGHLHTEDEPMGGYDPYSSSKGCAELVTAAYRRSFFDPAAASPPKAAIASARAGNVIGPGDWAPDRIVPDLITAWVNGTRAKIRNPSAVRPWQFVLEPLRGYLMLGRALATEGAEFGSAWNFGPKESEGVSVAELADRIREALGKQLDVHHETVARSLHEAAALRLDSTKANERLAWSAVLSFSRSIEFTVDGYQRLQSANPDALSTMNSILKSYWADVDAAQP